MTLLSRIRSWWASYRSRPPGAPIIFDDDGISLDENAYVLGWKAQGHRAYMHQPNPKHRPQLRYVDGHAVVCFDGKSFLKGGK
jgi:hypothetical protein